MPELVPPETSRSRSLRSAARAPSTTGAGSDPLAIRFPIVKARPPKRRIGIAAFGAADGPQMATRDPSKSRASMVGVVAGSSRRGRAIWIGARATTAAVIAGTGEGRHPPASRARQYAHSPTTAGSRA